MNITGCHLYMDSRKVKLIETEPNGIYQRDRRIERYYSKGTIFHLVRSNKFKKSILHHVTIVSMLCIENCQK
jgi:hypothetical protein